MPTSAGPNIKGEENLVFGYDLGDVINSYKGEPATNSQDYDISVMSQEGFDAWGCYDGNNSSPYYHYWGNAQSKTLVNIPGPDGKNVDAMLYHNFTGGFHGPTNWSGVVSSLLTNGSKITLQGWVKAADPASVGKTVSPHLYYGKVGGGSYSSSTSYTLTAEWQLVSHSYTVPEGSTGAGTMYFFTSGGTDIKMYLTKTAIVGGKLHAIQWLPGGTTRSINEGLLDIIGDNTISLNSVSFDNAGEMSFDGTDDLVTISDPGVGTSFSIEVVIKVNDFGNAPIFISPQSLGIDHFFRVNGAGTITAQFVEVADSSADNYTSSTVLEPDRYYHVVISKTASIGTLYVNGIAEDTHVPTLAAGAWSGAWRIGARWNSSYWLNGELPVMKVYNIPLSQEEVQTNFNSLRGRYNI